MSFQQVLLLGGAGFIGTIARYFVGAALPTMSTFLVNIVGALFIGYFYGLAPQKIDPQLLKIITIGLLGGFTTFSAFSIETVRLIEDGRWPQAVGYVLAMVLLGLVATYLGLSLAKN